MFFNDWWKMVKNGARDMQPILGSELLLQPASSEPPETIRREEAASAAESHQATNQTHLPE